MYVPYVPLIPAKFPGWRGGGGGGGITLTGALNRGQHNAYLYSRSSRKRTPLGRDKSVRNREMTAYENVKIQSLYGSLIKRGFD